MKTNIRLVAGFVFLLGAALFAQTAGLVRISVTPKKEKDVSSIRHGASYQTQSGTESVAYTIEVQNTSATAYDDVHVKWGILIQRYQERNKQEFFEGEKEFPKLGVGQKIAFVTDSVETKVLKYQYSGNRSFDYSDKVLGYYVRVIHQGKLIGQDVQPPQTLQTIETLRKKEK